MGDQSTIVLESEPPPETLEAALSNIEQTMRVGRRSETAFVVDGREAFNKLRSRQFENIFLYTRELIANARDATLQAGRRDPIYVDITPEHFSVRDSGIGMTRQDIEDFFLTLGSSGKTGENSLEGTLTGRFGIGAISALAESPEYKPEYVEIETIKNGETTRCRVFPTGKVQYLQPNGKPHSFGQGTKVTVKRKVSDIALEFKTIEEYCSYLDLPLYVSSGKKSRYLQINKAVTLDGAMVKADLYDPENDITGKIGLDLTNTHPMVTVVSNGFKVDTVDFDGVEGVVHGRALHPVISRFGVQRDDAFFRMVEIVSGIRKEMFESLGTMYPSLRGKEKTAAFEAIMDHLSKNMGDYPQGSSLLEIPLVADTAGENLSYRQIREKAGRETVFLIGKSDVDEYKKDPSKYTQPKHAPLIIDDRRIETILGKRNGVEYLAKQKTPKDEKEGENRLEERTITVITDETIALVNELNALLGHMPSVKEYLRRWGGREPVIEVVEPPGYTESYITFDPQKGILMINYPKITPWLRNGCAGRLALNLADWFTRREEHDYFPEARKGIIEFYSERGNGNR